MYPEQVGLRERKKAEQKLAIMTACVNALEYRELGDMKVDDLCDELGISKVTFFNYFRSKEQVLEYFVHKWQFEISGLVLRERLTDGAALRKIFGSVGDHPAGQHIMIAIVQFFLKQDRYVPMPITEYELYLFDPEAYERGARPIDIGTLLAQVTQRMAETPRERARLVERLIDGFYGVPIRLKISGSKDLGKAYRQFLQDVTGAGSQHRRHVTG